MKQENLLSILADSRRNNLSNEITGILLYSEGVFMQALEGKEDLVMELYKKIEQDPRHKNMIMLISDDIKERTFPEWSMAFLPLDQIKMDELKGYIDPLKKELFKGNSAIPAISILRTFAESNNLIFNN